MASGVTTCWICSGQFNVEHPAVGDNYEIDCSTCGRYKITRTLFNSRFPLPDGERYRLSFWTRQRMLDGREPPHLHSHSIRDVIAALPNPPPHLKPDLLLLSISKLFPIPGTPIALDWTRDTSLACAKDAGEMKFLFRSLRDRQFVDGNLGVMSIAGWERVAALSDEPQTSKIAFVAIHLTDMMRQVFAEAFSPAIRKAGFEPLLSDNPQHNERIDAKIMTDIKSSRFLVADVTGGRQGVYFEAGYAIGLRRPVIWTCNANHTGDMHFDTRQYNHILWHSTEELRETLYYRIAATI